MEQLAAALERVAVLERAARTANDGPPPLLPAAAQGPAHSAATGPLRGHREAFGSEAWVAATRPLFEVAMGTENMGPLLYSVIRFAKPEKVLEVGAGYTTLFALQALQDNDDELIAFERLERRDADASDDGFAWPMRNWANRGFLRRAGFRRSELHCVDNLAHGATTAHLAEAAAARLGLDDRLRFTRGDAFGLDTGTLLRDAVGGEGRVGLLWVDFGDGDRLDEALLGRGLDDRGLDRGFDTGLDTGVDRAGLWDLVDPNGGLVLVHSTLTNEASREWLARMKLRASGLPKVAGLELAYGPFEILSLLEPHKMRQNSVTLLRRKGPSISEPYNEPVFTKFS